MVRNFNRKDIKRVRFSLFDPLDDRWLMSLSIPILPGKSISKVRRSIIHWKNGLKQKSIFGLDMRDPITKIEMYDEIGCLLK